MARVAFIMDRIFRKFGLSGKSFIPMLIGTGCGVPGIMASRTIENERDRTYDHHDHNLYPLWCKASDHRSDRRCYLRRCFRGLHRAAYFVGIAAIICSGIILKKTKMFAGDPAPFVMELPAYHMADRSATYCEACGSVAGPSLRRLVRLFCLSTIVVWFTSNFGFVERPLWHG